MDLPTIIARHYQELVRLCQDFNVKRLYAFGSVTQTTFDPVNSDLDFIVELNNMPPLEKGETLLQFWNSLEQLFQKNVDLLSDKPIKNPYLRSSIEASKQILYDAANQ